MGKRLVMGPDLGPDDPATINLELGFVGGPGVTTRHDDGGNPSPNPSDTVGIIGRVYVENSAQNIADLVGVDFNDELVGTSGDDLIVWEQRRTGLGTDYYIMAGGGAAAVDNFILGAGNDLINLTFFTDNDPSTPNVPFTNNVVIDGGVGDDIVWSGQGNDNIFGGGGFVESLFGGAGNDVIFGSGTAFNNISGDSGNDSLFGGSSGDGIVGGTDDDIAFGNGGIDDILGESGNDTLFGGTQGDGVYGGDGNDTVSGDQEADNVDGGVGFLDTLYGGLGNDTLFDGDGARMVFAQEDNDRIDIGYQSNWTGIGLGDVPTISGGAGSDSIMITGGLNTTIGVRIFADDASGVGDGVDNVSMRGSYGAATVSLGGGADTFDYVAFANNNGNRSDSVFGGIGNDIINSGAGADVLSGDADSDTMNAGDGTDTLYGGAGIDTLIGGADVDRLFGDAGNDVLEGGAGGDSMYGGSETDAISYAGSAVAVTMGLSGALGTGGDAQGDMAWTDVENLTGSEFADSLHGNASINVILGLGGNDTIEGLGAGDSLDGGAGINWLSYLNSGSAVTINLFAGTGTGGDANGDTVANFQNLIGSAFNDTLTGSDGDNIIEGRGGIDTTEGRGGADSLVGGGNGDFLSYANSDAGVIVSLLDGTGDGGHATGDTFTGFRHIIGSAHDDSLIGDAQVNSIIGGLGNDTVEGGAGGDSLTGGGQSDFVSYLGSDGAVTVNLGSNAVSGGHATGDSIAGFSNVLGSMFDDSLIGSSGNNTIIGSFGADTVEAGAGDDLMYGGWGEFAENENDWLIYNLAGGAVQVSLFLGTATGAAGNDQFTSFQHLLGSATGSDFLEGDDDNNIIIGQGGNDTLSGLNSIDSLYGGDGNDLILAGTNGGTFENTTISGWDGDAGSAQIDVFVPIFSARVSDRMFGGNNTDTVDFQYLVTAPNSVFNTNDSNMAQYIAGIEIIVAGAAADVINLTFNDGVTRTAYSEAVTIYAGSNDDVVFSGSNNDVVVGGSQVTLEIRDGNDTLYGGAGNDLILGDDFVDNEAGGNDTLYGGSGLDTLYGGAADDSVFDLDGGHLFGGDGADLVVLRGSAAAAGYTAFGGAETANDGNDRVFTAGAYNNVTSDLGAGDDLFIASDVAASGARTDRVQGGSGNDVVSSWFGNDVLYGDTTDTLSTSGGSDALWGGAGSDTIYGGGGTDYLYGGAGDGDVIVGGAGIDYYYWSRTDGLDRIIDGDPNPVPAGGAKINAIIVFPDFDKTELTAGSDQLRNGTGVFETDHDLYDDDGTDMVQLVDVGAPGGTMELHIRSGLGDGTSVLTFDQQDISVIALWNNDATAGTPVITQYVWDPVDQRYEYFG